MIYWSVILLLISGISVSKTSCPVGTLITSLHQKTCTDKTKSDVAYYLDTKNICVPKCSTYSKEVTTVVVCKDDPDVCLGGYNCESRCSPGSQDSERCSTSADCPDRRPCGKYCLAPLPEDGENPICMAYHSNIPDYVDKWWTAKKFKPVCDDDGQWVPKQCKGGLQGRCMCYSSTGVRLFGEALYTKAENMTCACSRRKSDLEAAGRSYVSLHCDSLGNYEKLQCDMQKKLCWCAETQTGEPTAPFVPLAAMKKLPCYSEGNVGSQYLRQCESKKFAIAAITDKLKAHGVKTVESDTLLCDADGSYGAYSISSGIAYCTWRDNSRIGTWQANIAGLSGTLTCNCARDYKVYEHSLTCEGTGDYVVLQQVISDNGKKQYYCVDDKGFAKSDLLDDASTDCTQYY